MVRINSIKSLAIFLLNVRTGRFLFLNFHFLIPLLFARDCWLPKFKWQSTHSKTSFGIFYDVQYNIKKLDKELRKPNFLDTHYL